MEIYQVGFGFSNDKDISCVAVVETGTMNLIKVAYEKEAEELYEKLERCYGSMFLCKKAYEWIISKYIAWKEEERHENKL